MWSLLHSLRIIVPAAGAGAVIDSSENRLPADSNTRAALRAARLHLMAKADDAQQWSAEARFCTACLPFRVLLPLTHTRSESTHNFLLPFARTAVGAGVLLSGGVDASLGAVATHPAGAIGTAAVVAALPLLPLRFKALAVLATAGGWAFAEPEGVSELAKSGLATVMGREQQ